MQNNVESKVVDTSIVLSTLNARYIHSAFGLRYLQANMAELQERCVIEEFTLDSRPEDVVEKILEHAPQIVGFGVYIWNVTQTERVVDLLKTVAPDVIVILGGPEVSYESEGQRIVQLADYLISGWGELSFNSLVRDILSGNSPPQKMIVGEQPKLDQICMPYHLYTDDDIKNRILYVEASRGCPFKCEFCLSALDKTAWPFDLDEFLKQMEMLYQKGARHFKFVDRTFNLKVANSLKIMEFFLERMDDDLFLHFEVIPDHLPDALKQGMTKFPSGTLQFEIGIQTFNPEVQKLINRRQNNQKAKENLRWIMQNTAAYVHADLIFGLPGESLESFADSFDQLHALAPHEIQVGILKRLKGSPIVRHTRSHAMVFNPNPPFSIVSNNLVSFADVQNIARFARYWDLIGNSGRFKNTLPALTGDNPFQSFMQLASAIYERTGQTHKISLLRLYDLVFDIATKELAFDEARIQPLIAADFAKSGLKSIPRCLLTTSSGNKLGVPLRHSKRHNARQTRH